jgi:ribosome-associated protein
MASTKQIQVQQLLAAAAAACEDKKAEDIRILALDPSESGLTDYFLICTGMSDRQNVAITDEVELRLKREFGTYPNSVEGRRQGEWILMDYVDFIVHVFSAEKRAFYGLERLRKSATVLSIADLNTQLKSQMKAAITPGRKKSSKTVAAPKKGAAGAMQRLQTSPSGKGTASGVANGGTKNRRVVAAKKATPKKAATAKKAVAAKPRKIK